MLACVGVHYRDEAAVAACVLCCAPGDAEPAAEWTLRLPPAAPYEPGCFYLRELPYLLTVLAQPEAPLRAVIIDSHVWLGARRPGLGAHLYEALGRRVLVIGVAKTAYRGADCAVPVLRGTSLAPLQVTAAGMDPAAALIRGMHGPHRIPTLLRRVDGLAREG